MSGFRLPFAPAVLAIAFLLVAPARALDLTLPTPNDALLHPGHEAEFFQPTVEGTTESGMFGCVRSAGHRLHEGIDIKCVQRDRRGEPVDPVRAVADGRVMFINTKPGLSNYGRYIVLAHRWDGIDLFTLYAHLRDVADGLAAGQTVQKGQRIATLGHTSNTREGISRDRAHLHFEIDLLYSPHFHLWYPKHDPHAPPFGNFNGRNLIGLDPVPLLREALSNPKFSFAAHLARQPVAFTVLVGPRAFPWLAMHPEQFQSTANTSGGTVAAYEIGFTGWGLPVAVWPRSSSDLASAKLRPLPRGSARVYRVNDDLLAATNCEHLLERSPRSHGWQLSQHGRDLIELLTYTP